MKGALATASEYLRLLLELSPCGSCRIFAPFLEPLLAAVAEYLPPLSFLAGCGSCKALVNNEMQDVIFLTKGKRKKEAPFTKYLKIETNV